MQPRNLIDVATRLGLISHLGLQTIDNFLNEPAAQGAMITATVLIGACTEDLVILSKSLSDPSEKKGAHRLTLACLCVLVLGFIGAEYYLDHRGKQADLPTPSYKQIGPPQHHPVPSNGVQWV